MMIICMIQYSNTLHFNVLFFVDYDKDVLMLSNQKRETILHLTAKANHHALVSKLIQVSDEGQLNTALMTATTSGHCPYTLASCKLVKNILAWSEAQDGFYYLKMPPKVIIMYVTENRDDATKEMTSLLDALPQFSLEPTLLKNPTEKEMMDCIRLSQEGDDVSGLIVAIMSHGDRGAICARDKTVAIKDVLQQMNSPTLIGKPKVGVTDVKAFCFFFYV